MSNNKLIEIIPYNPAWPNMFENEALKIKDVLGGNCIDVYHVGSTSVPGLSAKPKIDIIAVLKDPLASIPLLEKIGYNYKGEWNIPFKYGFTKRGDIDVNLHAFEENHPEIELNLCFRDYLRAHLEAQDEYAVLKEKLLKEDASHQKTNAMFSGYNLGKDAFIQKILKEAGFNRLRFLKCTHYDEWEAYHRIKEEQIFMPIPFAYDRDHPSITDKNHHHFVMYHGVKIVTIAHVEFLNEDEAVLRTFATDNIYHGKGYGKAMMLLLEKWIKAQGRTSIKMHAALRAELFYRKLGYSDVLFDDVSIATDIIDLGKVL